MKATGIVRRLDELGRITLPIELRRTLDVTERDPLEIFVDESRIILQKYVPEVETQKCAFCEETQGLHKIGNGYVCRKHKEAIKNL